MLVLLAGRIAHLGTEMMELTVQSLHHTVEEAAMRSGTEMFARETTLRQAASSTVLSGTLNAEQTSTQWAAACARLTAPMA